MSKDQDWFVPLAEGERALYAFPHAGAGCAQLVPFARAAAEYGVATWSVNLPGRQARLSEPARERFDDLVAELADDLVPRLGDRPYALFGYCGGALLAYGVARALQARSAPPPRRLFAVSFEAPDIVRRPHRLPALPSEALWNYLLDNGGIPPGLGSEPALRQVAEPAIRADYAWLSDYRPRDGLLPAFPVTVCHGRADSDTPRGALLGWRRHTTGPVDLKALDGGHWLLDDACDQLVTTVVADESGRWA